MEYVFKARLSRLSKIITFLVFLIVLSIIIHSVFFDRGAKPTASYFVLSGVVIVLAIVYCYRPTGYMVDDRYIIIRRPFDRKKIALKDIKEIEQISYKELTVLIRLFGSGGFFGYFGVFHTTRFGKVYMNASHLKGLVMIILKNKRKIVISPDNASRFVSQAKKHISD